MASTRVARPTFLRLRTFIATSKLLRSKDWLEGDAAESGRTGHVRVTAEVPLGAVDVEPAERAHALSIWRYHLRIT
jgi:hypothetical protein